MNSGSWVSRTCLEIVLWSALDSKLCARWMPWLCLGLGSQLDRSSMVDRSKLWPGAMTGLHFCRGVAAVLFTSPHAPRGVAEGDRSGGAEFRALNVLSWSKRPRRGVCDSQGDVVIPCCLAVCLVVPFDSLFRLSRSSLFLAVCLAVPFVSFRLPRLSRLRPAYAQIYFEF